MSVTWKAVRVFISSTFRELRERCTWWNLHLIDVDMCWGMVHNWYRVLAGWTAVKEFMRAEAQP